MNASATSDFSPPESSDRRFVDLPAGVTSISTPASGCSSSSASAGSGASPVGQRLAADHRPRAHSSWTSRSRPRPPGNRCCDDVLEVLRRGLEGLLERLADAAVGLLDQPLELRERALEVVALRLELLDVRDGLLVLPLGERVHRAELLAAAHQPLHARRAAPRAPRRAAARRRARGSSPSRPASSFSSRSASAAESRTCCAATSAPVTASLARFRRPWSSASSCAQALQRGGGLLAGGGAGLELRVERVAAGRDGLACALERVGGALGVGRQRESRSAPVAQRGRARARARRARARCAPRAAARRAGRPSSSARRTASGPSSGASRRRAISHSERRTTSSASAASRSAARSATSAASRAGRPRPTAAPWRSSARGPRLVADGLL